MYQEGRSWLYNVQYLGVEERDDTPVQLHLSRNLNDKTRVLKPERKIRTTFQGRHIYAIIFKHLLTYEMCKVIFNAHVGCGKLLVVRPESISLPTRVDRALSFFSRVGIGTSPPPHPQASVPPPSLWLRGEGHTRLRERGGSKFRRGDIHCGYSIVCTLWSDPKRRAFSLRNDACGGVGGGFS